MFFSRLSLIFLSLKIRQAFQQTCEELQQTQKIVNDYKQICSKLNDRIEKNKERQREKFDFLQVTFPKVEFRSEEKKRFVGSFRRTVVTRVEQRSRESTRQVRRPTSKRPKKKTKKCSVEKISRGTSRWPIVCVKLRSNWLRRNWHSLKPCVKIRN